MEFITGGNLIDKLKDVASVGYNEKEV
jgi:serine/threonine protein kinase